LKSGRTSSGRRATSSHTGALASPDEYFDAFFRETGVIRADSIEEMVDCGAILAGMGRPVGRPAIITGSGGFCALTADAAEAASLELAHISADGAQRMRALVPFCGTDNPIDPTTLAADKGCFEEFIQIIAEEPDVDFIVYNTAHGLSGLMAAHGERIDALVRVAGSIATPMLVASELAPEDRARLVSGGITVTEDGERTVRALGKVVVATTRPKVAQPATVVSGDARGGTTVVDERVYDLLDRAGVPLTPTRQMASLGEAVTAANKLGYPVALKNISGTKAHKSESGGVALGISSDDELTDAWLSMFGSQDDGAALVQTMVTDGIAEIIVGAIVDDTFGPHVLVGAGGIFAEILDDTVIERAPVDAHRALDMLRGLRTIGLLSGARGRPVADVGAAADLIAAVSRLAADPDRCIAELEINPVVVCADRAVGVDALLVERPTTERNVTR